LEEVRRLLAEGQDLTVHIEESQGGTLLHKAVSFGHAEIVKLLLENGADLSAVDNDGKTPLFVAAAFDHEAILALLLSKGADVASKDANGRTALEWAMNRAAQEGGHAGVARLLLDAGADAQPFKGVSGFVSSWKEDASTPLHAAAAIGNTALATLLLDKGGDVAATDDTGSMPLHHAAQYTLSPGPETLHPKPETRNPCRRMTPSRKAATLNPNP
ncbi:ankyrin repeat-containing domain protein, partial [Baffinella frigidus]